MSLQSELDFDFDNAASTVPEPNRIFGIKKPDTSNNASTDETSTVSSVDTTDIPSSSATKGSWRTKAMGVLKHAHEVGQNRAQQKRQQYEKQLEQEKNVTASAMPNYSQHSKDSTSSITETSTVPDSNTTVDMPISSCDDDSTPIIQSTESSSSLDVNGRRRGIGKLLNVARRVDQLRIQQATTKQPMAKKPNPDGGESDLSDPNTAKLETSNSTIQPETTTKATTIEAEVTSDTTVESMQKEGVILTMEQAQKRLIDKLKKQLKTLEKDNRSMTFNYDSLKRKYDQEHMEHESLLKQTRKEVEERNLKLAVLEQHFIALNDPQLQDSTENDKDGNNVNDDDEGSITSYSDHSFDGDASVTGDVEEIPGTTTKPINPSEEVPPLPLHVKRGGSIVKLDKSYVIELQASLKQRTEKLENIEMMYSKLKESSSATEEDLSSQLEDLSQKLESRNQTIKTLEQSLKQLREARFKQKKSKAHQRRASMETSQQGSSAGQTVNTECSEDLSVASSAPPTPTENMRNQDEIIAEAVNEALEKKKYEHEQEVNSIKEELDDKDAIILKLEGKVNALSINKDNLGHRSNHQRPTSNAALMRSIAVTNEMMDTSMRRLENMTQKMNTTEKEYNEKRLLDPTQSMLDDDMAPIRRVATKVSLVHEEMKVSLMLIEQKLKNEIESASQNKSHGSEDTKAVTGQSSSEEQEDSVASSWNEIKSNAMKMIRETESDLNKRLDELKDQLQTIELEMEGKQDMIEALELACSEQIENYRKVLEEVEKLRAKVGVDDDVEEMLHDPASFLNIQQV